MIKVYTYGYNKDNGKPTQVGGCGIYLESHNNKLTSKRSFRFNFGNVTKNQADIKAAQIGLNCIADKYRWDKIQLYPGEYVARMLEKKDDNFSAKPVKNADIIWELREFISKFGNLTIINDTTEQYEIAKELGKESVIKTQPFDSETIKA